MITSLTLIILFVVSIVITVTVIYFVLKRRYTKAKFAFASLSALTSLSLVIAISLLARETPIQSIIYIFAKIYGNQYEPKSPNNFELVIICFITFLMHNTVSKIFQNWDGPVSVEDKKREVQKEKIGLFAAALQEVTRILKRQPTSPLYIPPKQTCYVEEIKPPEDKLAWHEHARELIVLRNPTLEFNPLDGWHEQECCWVGRNIRTQEAIFLGCSLKKPAKEQLVRFVQYIKRTEKSESLIGDKHYWVYRGSDPSFSGESDGIYVQCRSENELLDELVDFSDYFYDVVRRAERDYLPESEITIRDAYVESLCINESSSDEEKNMPIEEVLCKWVSEASSRHIALLGEYGQGKSTCALMFAYHQIVGSSFQPHRIPILVELRGKAPSTMSSDELLATWAVRFRINPLALKKLVIAGRILLIFDGFDEMAFIGQGDARIAHFRALFQFSYPNSKILITGRPNFFLDDTEMRSALGIRQAVPGRPHCSAIYLKPFTQDQIVTALRSFKESIRNEIHDLAGRNPRFFDLASRPCLLYIIGVLWERKRNELSKQITSASVIDLFINYSLDRQEAKARAGGRFMILRTPERAYFMEGIAVCMLTNNLPNQILVRELRSLTLTLLSAIPDSVSKATDAMTEAGGKPLRHRIGDDENMHEALHTDIRTYGLLVNDPSKSGTMRFAHKSFMEYLGAKIVAKGITNPDDDACRTLMNTFGIGINNITERRETAAFFAESIASGLTNDEQNANESLAAHLLRVLVPSNLSRKLFIPILIRRQLIRILTIAEYFRRDLSHKKENTSSNELDTLSSPGINDNTKELHEQMKSFVKASQPLKSLITTKLGVFSITTFFLIPGVRNLTVRFTAWKECCIELGISPEAMANVISPELSVYFEFEKQSYLQGLAHFERHLPFDFVSVYPLILFTFIRSSSRKCVHGFR